MFSSFHFYWIVSLTTHTACQTVPILGVEVDGGLEEENVYFQVRYLPSKGEDQLTQSVVILALGHPVEDCGRGTGPRASRHRHFWG